MTNEIKSFRDILRNEFQSRLKQDPHYRLLDFAKDLATPISRMSEIMSGRSGISSQRALHYTESLKLNPEEKSHFLELVSNECSRTKWTRKGAGATPQGSHDDVKKLLSTSLQVPVEKRSDFLQYLKSCLENWSSKNFVENAPMAKITIIAHE